MSISASDQRCTRSQTPQGTPMAPTTLDHAYGFSKAGRRVLAELACNDSPVVGLLPAGTPASSCKQKWSSGTTVPKSRREVLTNPPPSHTASTPLGESLLRSQVHLLLKRVESDTCALPCCHRTSVHSDVGAVLLLSPVMSAAPTPWNTPATMAVTTQAPQPVKNASVDAMPSQDTGTKEVYVRNGLYVEKPHHQAVSSVSTTMSADKQYLQLSPSLSEESDMPSSTEIFAGKRSLHFDDDTPCKAPGSDTMTLEESGCNSVVRELDDDEVSAWSVNVNVGSPADNQSIMENHGEGTVIVELGVSPSNEEHMKKIQEASSSKVDLLWDRVRSRKPTPYRRGSYAEAIEDRKDEDADDTEGGEDLEDEWQCDTLCDMFQEMRVEEEERKGLPRGEGKHIRFLYGEGEEEIVEAMAVNGEEDILHGCSALRLTGLPVPLGRHWRFEEEDDDEEAEDEEASNH